MPRPRPPLSIPVPQGIDRFRGPDPAEALGWLESGLDVINDEGALRRRDAFTTIGHAEPFHLPAGAGYLIKQTSGGTQTNYANRALTLANADDITVLYFGCTEVFDGIDWRYITSTPTPGKYIIAELDYSTGVGTWTAMPWMRDSTAYPGNGFFHTLCRDGTMVWHRSQFSGWSSVAVNSITRYWVRVRIMGLSLTGSSISSSAINADITIAAPGPIAFHLNAANGLMPARMRNGNQKVLVGCDRTSRRGQEQGAGLGVLTNDHGATDSLVLLSGKESDSDEGAGVYGAQTNVGWNDTGTWDLGTSANGLQKLNTSYDWWYQAGAGEPPSGQFRGGALQTALQTTGSPTTTSVPISGLSAVANEFEHCRLRVTTGGGGGPAAAEEREILPHSAGGTLSVYDAFSAAPNGTTRMAICRPNARAIIPEDRDYEVLQHHTSAGDDALTLVTARPFAPGISTTLNNKMCHLMVGWRPRWVLPAGRRWSWCFDPVTNVVILTNGAGELLSFDGYRLRRLQADTSSILAQEWSGKLGDSLTKAGETQRVPLSKLDGAPPRGKVVLDYQGRIVVIGTYDGHEVAWSAPGFLNNLWPFLYRQRIRDNENNAPVGGATLGDRLIIWTPTAIHAGGPATDLGEMNFTPVAQGTGFINHHSVIKASIGGAMLLMGVTPAGISAFNGAEPFDVLDRWDRLLDGGVSKGHLDGSCGAWLPSQDIAVWAVPGAGSSTNNKLVLYKTKTKGFWVFSLPFGCSSLAVERDDMGNERLLIGTDDGMVQTFTNAPTDDGGTITGTARTAPLSMAGERAVSLQTVLLKLKNMGTATVTVKTYVDKKDVASQSVTVTPDGSLSVYGTATYTTGANVGVYGDAREREERVRPASGTIGTQIQIEITGSSRWQLSEMTAIVNPKGQRG